MKKDDTGDQFPSFSSSWLLEDQRQTSTKILFISLPQRRKLLD